MKGNKCNGRLLSPTGSHGSIAGSRAIRQWEKSITEWEVLDLLHGITSERKQELRQCDVWEWKQRDRSGESWAGFSGTSQPLHFSSPWAYFDDLGTHLTSVLQSLSLFWIPSLLASYIRRHCWKRLCTQVHTFFFLISPHLLIVFCYINWDPCHSVNISLIKKRKRTFRFLRDNRFVVVIYRQS